MATLRATTRIDRPAADVWAAVSDAGGWSAWFPGGSFAVEGSVRTLTLGPGIEIVEDIVTNDDELRRFQYSVSAAPFPVASHLGTVDVLDVDGSALVVYSTEIEPAELAAVLGPGIEAGVAGLKAFCESS
jgi:uncharacterized protein YndB with AHSA1/START domain